MRELVAGRNARREFDQFVVHKRHARLQSERHGHAIHTFHRVIDEHHRRIQPQRLVDGIVGPRCIEALGDEGRRFVASEPFG